MDMEHHPFGQFSKKRPLLNSFLSSNILGELELDRKAPWDSRRLLVLVYLSFGTTYLSFGVFEIFNGVFGILVRIYQT